MERWMAIDLSWLPSWAGELAATRGWNEDSFRMAIDLFERTNDAVAEDLVGLLHPSCYLSETEQKAAGIW